MLARLLDSLVRVSRRVVKDHFVKGAQVGFVSLEVKADAVNMLSVSCVHKIH